MDSAHVLASAGGTTVRSRLSSAGLELIDCPHDGKKEVVDKAIIGTHEIEPILTHLTNTIEPISRCYAICAR